MQGIQIVMCLTPHFERTGYAHGMRKSDGQKGSASHFRAADRVMRMNDQWWFTTREGDMGPYNTRDEAEAAVTTYIASQQFVEKQIEGPKQKVQPKSEFKGDTKIWDRQIDSV